VGHSESRDLCRFSGRRMLRHNCCAPFARVTARADDPSQTSVRLPAVSCRPPPNAFTPRQTLHAGMQPSGSR
jgi:hypothetical protein